MKDEQKMPELNRGWNPNPWIAALLGFLLFPWGAMYVGKKKWVVIYLAIFVAMIIVLSLFAKLILGSDLNDLKYVIPTLAAFHLFHLAKKGVDNRPFYSRWYVLLGLFLVLFTPYLSYKVFYKEAFRIPSNSMSPNINQGDIVHAIKWGCGNYQYLGVSFYNTKATEECNIVRGDVIVFQYPRKPEVLYIKRVVAIGGDDIKYDNKKLILNNSTVTKVPLEKIQHTLTFEETIDDRKYKIQNSEGYDHPFGYTNIIVPENNLYVVGDNRDHSSDSRVWGVVPLSNVVGKIEE